MPKRQKHHSELISFKQVQKKDQEYCKTEIRQDFNEVINVIPSLKKQANRHLQICMKVSQGTFSSDKIVRLISNVLKLTRNFKLITNLKALEKTIYQILQLRRLLRINRLCLILRDYHASIKKQKLTNLDCYMLFFRGLLLYEDCTDIFAYMIQMKMISYNQLLPQLRKKISDLYFFECVGWLIYYTYEYMKSDNEQLRKRNKIVITRYILDTIISHNDYSNRKGTLDLKIISILGIISSVLNLSLVWS